MVVSLTASAFAQTTVTGNLDFGYKALSEDLAAQKTGSGRGFGNEGQINIQNKGKLNIAGWEYAAGFSIEQDGNQTTDYFNENQYIDFINGNTTITFGQDHIQNNDQTKATFVGLIAEDMANGGATDLFLSEVGAHPNQSFGVGIMQTIPNIGRVSALYVPSNNDTGTAQSTVARPGLYGDEAGFIESDGESAYEIGFQGSLGVKGLDVIAFINKEKATTGYKATESGVIVGDTKGTVLGLSYNMGQITAGYTYKKSERGFAAVADGREIKQDEFGLAYAVTPALTLAANYTKADGNGTTKDADAKMKSLAVGYNLGPVAVTAQAAQLENYTGVAGRDADVLYLRASTKF